MDTEKKSNGAIIGLVVIIIILIIGGIYMWKSGKDTRTTETITTGTEVAPLTEQDSTDLNALDQDVETVDTNIEANAINSVE